MNSSNIIYRILKWLTDEEVLRTSSEFPRIQYLTVEMSRKAFGLSVKSFHPVFHD